METEIVIRPSKLNVPLRTLYAGVLSSAVVTAKFVIPEDVTAINLLIDTDADGATQTAAAGTLADGVWRFYLSPFYFPSEGTFNYHLVATDTEGNARWLGTGRVIVAANPANGTPVTPPIIPADTYIYNPSTGLYHKLTAVTDETGTISIEVAEEGISK